MKIVELLPSAPPLVDLDNMHFAHIISLFFNVFRHNLHYYECYHVVMEFLHSSHHITHKLKLQ